MKLLHAVLSITFTALAACSSEKKSEKLTVPKDINTIHVKTEQVQSSRENQNIQVLGFVLSESESKPSFKTGGVIEKTFVKEGDMVRKGQLLATLIMSEIDAQVRQAEEGLAKTERDMKRVKNMHADSVATLEQLQNTLTANEVAKRNVEIARFNRTYSEVRSPIAGKVLKQLMRSGEITGPGTPVYAIMGVGDHDWKINAGLVDRDWARVNIGDEVTIEFDAYPGKVFAGTVSDKAAAGVSASGTFDIEIKFKNQPQKLAAGLVARLSIHSRQAENMVLIPIDAVVKSNDRTALVYTVVNGKAKKLELQIAKILGDKIAISKGLEGVAEVVTIGAMYLEDGDSVSIH